MIQRIQTIYLSIAALILIMPVILDLSFASMVVENDLYQLKPAYLMLMTNGITENVGNSFPIAGAIALSLLLTIYAIAQYKNRKFQMKLVQLAMLIQLVIGVLVFFYADSMTDLVDSGSATYSPALGIFAVNVLLYFLALRGIKKDDDLVRSADRLR